MLCAILRPPEFTVLLRLWFELLLLNIEFEVLFKNIF